jgi:hypothetical protein
VLYCSMMYCRIAPLSHRVMPVFASSIASHDWPKLERESPVYGGRTRSTTVGVEVDEGFLLDDLEAEGV